MHRTALLVIVIAIPVAAVTDKQVSTFLTNNKDQWRDLNVPYVDGQTLYDLIIKRKYQQVLEIGTSTGHSAIWMAWALSKTGGKLTTIEISKERYEQARANFEKAGVGKHVNLVLGDAHKLVPAFKGPLDMVFADADKEWYIKYFKHTAPRLRKGGAFVAHNVSMTWMKGMPAFRKYLKGRSDFRTTINSKSRAGMSISVKK